MSASGAEETRGFSPSELGRLVEACERFEAAWRRGEKPRIEDSLTEAGLDVDATQSLSRLLSLEVSLRLEAGESPGPVDYLARFPASRGLIEALFASRTTAADATVDAPPRSPADAATSSNPLVESTVRDGQTTTAHGEDHPDAPRDEPSPSWSASRFEVGRFHDAGMLGEVFIARDLELNRDVALKVMRERTARHAVNRKQFVLEGMVTGGLEHPGIVPVYSLGTREDGRRFYAMRFIQGPSLRDGLKRLHGAADAPPLAPGEERPTLPRLLRHFIAACHAVAYAHSRGVLHRDLKPEHVLLGPFGETLVVDWGLAIPIPRAAAPGAALEFPAGAEAIARDGGVVGTLAFMSPEQALGVQGSLDGRGDVYSLGAILYALLTGRAPIQGGEFATMLSRARRGEFPPPREVARGVPPALEAICLKAMAHAPSDRYATAAELARDVERWLDDEPTVAYPEPIAARVGRSLRRHRTAAVGGVVAMLCTLAGLVALNVQMADANARLADANAVIRRERDRAEVARGDAVAAAAQREANFNASLNAINGYLRRIGSGDIPNAPGTTALRGDIANVTARLLDTLWEQEPADAEVRYMAGRAYREHANILRLLAHPTDDSYRRAVELLRGAAAAKPRERRYRDYLAETLRDAAGRHKLANRPDAAAPLLAEAVELTTRLRAERPDEPNYARSDARGLIALAENLTLIGSFEEARAHAERALALMRPLADGDAPGPTDRLEVVAFLCVLGGTLVEAGRPAEAAPALYESIDRAGAAMAAAPGSPDPRFLAGYARMHRARALAALGRHDEATTTIAAAAADFDGLASEYPEVVHYRRNLAETLIVRAEWRASTDAPPDDARLDLDRARTLAEGLLQVDPENLDYAGLLGRAEGRSAVVGLRLGDRDSARSGLERAIALHRRVLATNPRSPQDLRALEEWEAALATIRPPGE